MLRAVAAIMVLLYHGLPQYEFLNGKITGFKFISSIGFSGVDIFFVISGFVAAHTTFSKKRTISNAWRFLTRRLIRIYFGYWPFFFLASYSAIQVTKTAHKIDWVNSFFLTSVEMEKLLIYVTWSLTYELIFYLIITVSFIFTKKLAMIAFHFFAIVITFLMIQKIHHPLSPNFIFLSYLLEFIAGLLIFFHHKKCESKYWLLIFCAVVLVGFISGGYLYATDGSIRIFTFGLGSAALVMLALKLEETRLWVANPVIVAIGDSSYTIYLGHASIFLFLYVSGFRGFLSESSQPIREAGFFIFLIFGIWSCHIFYENVESPLYKFLVNKTKSR